jgi:hypothetical protein
LIYFFSVSGAGTGFAAVAFPEQQPDADFDALGQGVVQPALALSLVADVQFAFALSVQPSCLTSLVSATFSVLAFFGAFCADTEVVENAKISAVTDKIIAIFFMNSFVLVYKANIEQLCCLSTP